VAAAISAAQPGDVITLLNGSTFTENGLTIDKNLTINVLNNGTAIISGNNSQIFSIKPDSTVYLENLAIINGSGSYGGAIYNESDNLTIKNCTFKNNTATNGGAIFNLGTITEKGKTYQNNTATITWSHINWGP
jgi:predicted outer membrane repeat protein